MHSSRRALWVSVRPCPVPQRKSWLAKRAACTSRARRCWSGSSVGSACSAWRSFKAGAGRAASHSASQGDQELVGLGDAGKEGMGSFHGGVRETQAAE
ncbi:hypothetical protein CLOM_g10573 [Closterium sp. NIES-68]|nr:hypothetical protein CLOM_g10573 [Closterium sp. NIES-68]